MSASWIRADWPAPANIVAGTTTRLGGVSEGVFASLNLGAHVGDDPARVAENRARFVIGCGLPAEPAWLSQVHGSEVAVAGSPGFGAGAPRADAVIAHDAGKVCAVLTADCLPILLCSDDGAELAAIHGGWRGLAQGVIEATLRRMRSPPGDLLAWLGPAISQPAFEVGAEVRDAFLALDEALGACFRPTPRGRWQADIYALATRRLASAGVERIHGGGFCTFADTDRFFSYRRDGQCGRMASFVFRNS